MPDTREARSVVEAAEQAAAASNYAQAEQLLREAALLQEADLGPLHPDLANTLNNLGVVCEITDKPVDAERFFRRAYAIATAALALDHPFVATSRKNLEDFCETRGIAVAPPIPEIPPERPSNEESPEVAPQVAPTRSSRPLAISALIAGALLFAFLGAVRWSRSNDEARPLETPTPSPARDRIPAEIPRETSEAPPAPAPAAAESRATETPISRAPVVAAQSPIVASAQVCSDLSTGAARGSSSEWQCVSPSLRVNTGSLFFYTRVKSPTDTTVEHRWYRGNRLFQVVELRIRANTSAGYRTYSKATVNNESPADWRVELRTTSGDLLHEERFAVH
jgi:tetratricopeptide repeat protein/DUF2914 family protein